MINQQIDADINSFIKARRKSTHKYECERRKNFIRFKAMNNNRRISLAYTRCVTVRCDIRLNVTHEKYVEVFFSRRVEIYFKQLMLWMLMNTTLFTLSTHFPLHLLFVSFSEGAIESLWDTRSRRRWGPILTLATCNRKSSGKVEREKNSRISYSTLFSKVFYEVVKIAWPARVRRALVSRRLGNSLFSCLFSYHSTQAR